MKQQDLAEKRRVAHGWLDRDKKILEPEKQQNMITPDRMHPASSKNLMNSENDHLVTQGSTDAPRNTAGDDLDRAFGRMGLR